MSAFLRPFVRITFLSSLLLLVISARAEIPVSITYQDAAGSGFYDNSPRTAVTGNSGTTLGEQRRNAFEAAVYHWSKLLNGTVTLRVRAIWVSQGTSTLASASPLTFASDWNGVPVAGRYYPGALANQLAALDHDPNNDDIQVVCNSDWDSGVNSGKGDPRKWYYGTDGVPGSSDFDFYSVVLHELGHGFGFGSFLNTDGSWQNGMPTIYDHFLSNSSGSWVRTLTQSQRAAVITSGNLFSAGSTTTSVNYDQWAKIYAPAPYVSGSSLSHLDESTYSGVGSVDECMTPIASFPTHNIGPVATALLRDMGYNFVDNQAPSVAITLPANGSSRSGLTIAVGTATDNSSTGDAGATGLREVRISLFRQAGGNWFNWSANMWGSTTFDWNTHVKKADASIVPIGKGTRSWAIALPTLADGVYEIQAQSVDQMNLGSAWVKSTFTIDRSAPSISFDPLHTNSVVFNFSQLGGIVNEATSVSYAISDVTDSPTRFWNGSAWVTSGIVYLPGTISADRWVPANSAQLPSRAQIRLGNYVLYAKAFDAASNSITASIPVTRSASDSTPPDVVISSPTNNQVLIARTLPTLTGTAIDSESGIGNISVYLMRLAESGFLYWNGSNWSETVSTISANYDSASNVWQANGTLPSGNDLPNGSYQLQVSAQNQENPPGTRGVSAVFVVDYHPTYTWTGGGANDNFDNPGNWSPIAVPPSDALVIINSGTCDASAMGSLSLWGVNIGGSGTFTTPGLFVKKLNLSAGTLNGGAINIDGDNGVFNWTGGQVNGTLSILSGAIGNFSGSGSKALGSAAVLNNSGTINWSGGGPIYNFGYNPGDRATVNNHGVFNLLSDGNVFSSSYYRSFFNNFVGAIFKKSGGSGTSWANDFDFSNSGELRAESGTIGFNGQWSVAGGSEFSGNGNFLFQSGTLSIGGDVRVNGAKFTLQSGTLNGAPNFVLTTSNGGSFEWTGGSVNGTLEIAPGTVFNISGSSSKGIGGASLIRNRGNITWSGTGNIDTYAYSPADRSTFRNMSGATLSIIGSASFTYTYNASIFNNESGAVILKSAGNASGFDWVFNNDGAVECSSGTMFFNTGGNSSGSFLANLGTVIRFGGGNQTLNNGTQLGGAGKFQIQSGTVTRNGTLQLGGVETTTVELISGTFAGNGALAGNAALNWTGGTISGQLDLGTNIVVNVSGSSGKSIGGASVINNGGNFNWGGTGYLDTYASEVTNRATFNNLSNAVFTITSNATFSVTYNASIFNNLPGGKVIKSEGAGTTRFDWVFNSFGTVRCASGLLLFAAGGDSGGAFTAETNSIVRFGGGTHTLTNNTILDGAGKIEITSGTVTHNGDVLTGTIETPATLEISGGIFNGSGALNGICTVNWTGGTIGGGRIDATPGITFNVSGSSTKSLGGPTLFNNSGVFNWLGTGRIDCYAYDVTNRSVFNNLSNGVFNIQGDGSVFSVTYNASIFSNYAGGLLLKSGGAGTNTLDSFVYVNAGEVRAESGTISFNSKLDLNPGSIFTGFGTVKLKGDTTLATALQSASHIALESGTLTGLSTANPAPSFSGSGGVEWNGGSIVGSLTVNSGVIFDVNGSSTKSLGTKTVWNNYGTVNWNGSGNLDNYAYQPADAATIYNRSGAIWNHTSDADFTYTYNRSKFYNESGAIFRKSAGTGVTSCDWDFSNTGSLEILNGTLGLLGANTTIGPAATTTLSLGGTTAGNGYSQITRSGAMAFNGHLQIVLTNGFVPTNGAQFNLVTYTSRTGQFGSVALPQLPFGSNWKLSYGATALTAEVVAATLIQNSAKLANNQFQFDVTGQPAAMAIVETSTNLVQWIPVATNEPFAGNWTFSDSFQTNAAARFYRVIIVEE